MTLRPFQFTLRRMMVAVAYFSAAFALAAGVLQIWQTPQNHNGIFDVLLAFFGPFAIMALLGAGIGYLAGETKHGAEYGIATGGVLFVLWIIQQGFVSMLS
jgi:hypothetical protein